MRRRFCFAAVCAAGLLGLASSPAQTSPTDDLCQADTAAVISGAVADAQSMVHWIKANCAPDQAAAAIDALADRASASALRATQSSDDSAVATAKSRIAQAGAVASQQSVSNGAAFLAATSPASSAAAAADGSKPVLCQQMLANANACRTSQNNMSSVASPAGPGAQSTTPTGQAGALNDCYNLYMNGYHAEHCG